MDNDLKFLNVLFDRKSVRKFTDNVVEQEKVDALLHAAMSAPSARNIQPWKFIVVNDRNLLNELGNALPYAKMLLQATLCIIVCSDLRGLEDNSTAQGFWVQDCSAATENILLAVEALSLGACWTGCYPREDRQNIVKEILNVPDGVIPFSVIPIGYPQEDTPVKEKFKQENIFYNKF